MITKIILLSLLSFFVFTTILLSIFYFRLKAKYHVVSENPKREAHALFAELISKGQGLFLIEKIEERDFFLRRN